MSYNSSLNSDVVKTAIDDVFFQKFSGELIPGFATAEDPMVFRQDTMEHAAVILDVFKGVGNWQSRTEEQDVPLADPRIGNQKTFTAVNWDKGVEIPKNFFDDNMHGAYEKMVENFARRARTTRDTQAFGVYNNSFTTALTADGGAIFSSHTNLNGDSVNNLLTSPSPLNEPNLNTAIVTLMQMKSQDGIVDGYFPRVLLVPPQLFKLATEISESELRSGTGNNDLNFYLTKFGIYVKESPYLGSTTSGGSDTAWYLLSSDHSIYRFVRQSIQTTLVDWSIRTNNNYLYKGEFREIVGAMSYEGAVGSTGV